MSQALLLSTLLFVTTASAEGPKAKNTESVAQRFEKACRKAILDHDKDVPPEKEPEKVCHCLASSFSKKASPAELAVFARSQEGDKSAETELQAEKYAILLELRAEMLKRCRLNPAWKIDQ